MRCFDFSVVVWGDVHTGIFLDVGLPSLLSPGNLPGLASIAEARLLLFTRAADLRRMESSSPFRLLRALITVETVLMDRWFDGEQKPSPHALMSRAHRESFKAAFERNADAVFIPPECVWADGSMVNLERIVSEQPVKIVHISGIRLVLESFAPELVARWRSADAATLTIRPRELVEAGITHLHPIMRDHFFEEMGDDLVPSNLLWRVGDEGIVARCFHLHPLLVAPDQRNDGFRRTIDDDLPLSGDREQEYVVADSDEVFVYELSSITHKVQAGYVKASVSDIAAWGEVAANARHRQLVRTIIRIHGERMSPDLWASVEQRAETTVADAMELMGMPTRQLLALHENVVAHRALSAKYGGSTFAAWLAAEGLSLGEAPPQLRAWIYQEFADAHKERGDFDQAVAEYTEAIGAAEFNAQEYGSRAISLAAGSNWKSALATVEAGLSRSRYDRGLRALHRWLRQRLDRGEALPSDSPGAPFLAESEGLVRSDTRVSELRTAGDLAGVVTEYAKRISSEGGSPVLHYLRGMALAEIGEHEAALADFEASLALQPDNPTVSFAAERERLILSDGRVHELRAAGDIAGVISEYEKRIASGGGGPVLRYLRGMALAEIGEHEAALTDFEASLALQPDNPTVSFAAERERLILCDAKVRELRAVGDISGVVAEYEKRIASGGGGPVLRYLRGMALAEIGEHEAALADFEASLALQPHNPTLSFAAEHERLVLSDGRGRELRAAGDLAGAVAEYDKCIASEDGGAALYYLRGTAVAEMGRHEAALADFEASLALQPENLTVAFVAERERLILCDMRARERRAAGDLAGAVAEYRKSISSGTGNPTLYYLRGAALAEMGEHAAALADFEAALALEPDNPTLSFVVERERLVLSDTPVKKLLRGLRFAQMRIYARLFFRRDEPRPWHPAWLSHRARVRAVCRAIPDDTRIAVLINADGLLIAGLRRSRPRLSVVTEFTGSGPATQTRAPAAVPRLWLPPLGDVEQPGAPPLEAADPHRGITVNCYAGPGTEVSRHAMKWLRKRKGALSGGPLRFVILGIGVIVFPVVLPASIFAILVGNMAGMALDGLSSLKARPQREAGTDPELSPSDGPDPREERGEQGTQELDHTASEMVLEPDREGEDRIALAPLRAAGAQSAEGA